MSDVETSAARGGGCGSPLGGKLSEYVDGELAGAELRRLEDHLATCAVCGATVADLRDLVAQARTLDRPSEPGRDLWPAIQGRLTPRPSSRWRQWLSVGTRGPAWRAGRGDRPQGRGPRWLVPSLGGVAALVVVSVGAAIWLGLLWREPVPVSPASAVLSGPAGRAAPSLALDDDREHYDTIARLRREVQAALAADPKVVDVLEQNLAVLDVAIAEYRDALAERPGDSRLSQRLVAARDRKAALLRQAAALAAGVND